MRFWILVFTLLSLSFSSISFAENDAEGEAYWDYGVGFGAVRFAEYPASSEYTVLALPAPTFQYRGKILRADDRDGAHLYLLKEKRLTIEFSGDGSPALDSKNNAARAGMENLPWVIALGPQLVFHVDEHWEFALGIYQAMTTDFQMTRVAGNIFSGQATYEWTAPLNAGFLFKEPGYSTGKIILSAKAGTKEYLSVYFDVPQSAATTERAAYDARDGFLSHTLSYYQSFKSGRVSLYAGASLSSYELSANRQSPLHKSDHNLAAFVGLNYTLGGSSRPAVPESETSGVINSLRNRQLRDAF